MARVIMIQGTSSGVGKSMLTAALCKIFTEDGYKVAPFKAQNMSANAHVFPTGEKMARSQAVAAYACGKEPHADMNPILLMPLDKGEIDVIIRGRSAGLMSSPQYGQMKQRAFEEVICAFERLSGENDIIVAEGAGSPVELNLNKNDIVNMGFAKKVNAPVLLVSDIVRGGVFASLYGTVMLMSEDEKKLVKGIIVNKFKGNKDYFADGIKLIEDICQVPVKGVVPYIDVDIEDEDSLTDGAEMKTRESIMASRCHTTQADYRAYLDGQLAILGAEVRKHIDINSIYGIMEGR